MTPLIHHAVAGVVVSSNASVGLGRANAAAAPDRVRDAALRSSGAATFEASVSAEARSPYFARAIFILYSVAVVVVAVNAGVFERWHDAARAPAALGLTGLHA
jgi:hypothetical protein